jgi:hypothetical protein
MTMTLEKILTELQEHMTDCPRPVSFQVEDETTEVRYSPTNFREIYRNALRGNSLIRIIRAPQIMNRFVKCLLLQALIANSILDCLPSRKSLGS